MTYRTINFTKRNLKEMSRDSLSYIFSVAFPLVMLAAAACCVPRIIEKGKAMLLRHGALRFGAVMAALALCLAALAKSTYNPCLYFHF